MSEKIDYLVQDNEALVKAIDGNRAAMDAKGFTDTRYTALVDAGSNLVQKEAAQQRAVKLVVEKTAEQNDFIKSVAGII